MWKWIFILCITLTANLSAEKKVLAFAGSTREDSINKKLVNEAANIARQMGATVTVIDLKDYPMPFYDGDLEDKTGMPAKAREFRQLMIQNQVIFIASPEYNASISGVLKNALDWASREDKAQPSTEALQGKKFAIMSASPGGKGGARGLVHLRAILEHVGGMVIQQQVTVPNGYEAFNDQGQLKNSQTKAQLQQLVQQALR